MHGYDVKGRIAFLKEFVEDFKRIKNLPGEMCPNYRDIGVLEALLPAEQELLAQRIVPSNVRATEICAQLGIERRIFDDAIHRYLQYLPSKEPCYEMNDEAMFKAIAKLIQEEKQKGTDLGKLDITE